MSADCAPQITLIEADNRGLIVLEASSEIFGGTVDSDSVQVTTAGADLLFGTADDVSHSVERLSVSQDGRRFELLADVPADSRYRVRLDSSMVRGPEGFLDGEFNGAGETTGDGQEGGDLVFFTAPSASPIARITTTFGVIDVQLFPGETPISVANFLNVANLGRFDFTIFHRSVPDFVIQGGGFQAEPPFESIERVDPIQNEPGISNTRGTIAFAKVSGNPNSATTEFFFNVEDNPNLDTQNGGFTVFGEIADEAGLAVMDTINGFERVNLSSLQSALTDVPSPDPEAIESPQDAMPSDLVVVERVAAQMDISDTPPGQPAGESLTLQGGGSAFVTIFDIAGSGLDQVDEMMTVRFSRDGNSVASVVLQQGFPEGAGIAIGGAEVVGDIVDARRGGDELAFIVSNVEFRSLFLRSGVTGANLNSAIVSGMLLDSDIDGDGRSDDLTAILTLEGRANSIFTTEAIGGDVVLPGGLDLLRVGADLRDLDIVLGRTTPQDRPTDLILAGLREVSIEVDGPINTFIANEWRDGDESPDALEASSLNKLVVRGDFEADLTLTQPEEFRPVLNVFHVVGDLRNARIDAAGDASVFVVRGDVRNVDATIDGDLIKLVGGAFDNVNFEIAGAATVVVVDSWFGGELIADTITKLVARGGRTSGDFAANLTLNNTAGEMHAARVISIRGDVFLADWRALDGGVQVIQIIGDLSDSTIDIDGGVQKFVVGDVTDSDVDAGDELRVLIAGQWDGGSLTADRATGVIQIGGDARGLDLTTERANRVIVLGDVDGSDFRFDGILTDASETNIRQLLVRGEIVGSKVLSRFFITDLQAGGLRFSSVVAGAIGGFEGDGFPDIPTQAIDRFGTIFNMHIDPPARGEEPNVVDSFVVAAAIQNMFLGEVDPNNFGRPYGVAAAFISTLNFFTDGTREFFSTDDARFNVEVENPTPDGDFQIRPEFQIPGQETPQA